MLPSTHRDPYQKFQQVLQEMPESAVAIDLEKQLLPEKFQSLQQLFENEIATLSADDISPDYASRWQSVQTEFYRQMRLLETDVMLLKASRSQATSQSRGSRICDRIKTLIQYCEVLLQL
ncbi:MAG TPA: heterocyst frequency control protein PatD [Candidatus Sericytochromatia bacterium]|jgi:hypothetical protein